MQAMTERKKNIYCELRVKTGTSTMEIGMEVHQKSEYEKKF